MGDESKDSLIDSLSIKLNELQHKQEKYKPVVYTKKSSILTKEQEYNKKALFIYNFAKDIEWPTIYNGTDFVIGVAGDVIVLKELKTLLQDKKVSGKKITVEEYIPGNRYNVVYISSSRNENFETIKKYARKNKTLLVTDDQNLINSGAHISFIIDQDKIRYIANKPEIEKVGLKVSEELMRYSG